MEELELELRPVTQVELYVQMIYNLLNTLDKCFFSGAFIIEDPEWHLMRLLLSAADRERLPGRTALGTHRGFMKELQCELWLDAPTRAVTEACGRQFEIDLSGLRLACNDPRTDKQYIDKRNVLLFYGFRGPSVLCTGDGLRKGDNIGRYVYMKLETSSYLTPSHGLSATTHYGVKALKGIDARRRSLLKKKKKKEDTTKSKKAPLPTRREDRMVAKLVSEEDYAPYLCAKVQCKAANYDAHLRKGSEFFLPSELNNTFLNRAETVVQTYLSDLIFLNSCPLD